MNQSSSYGKVVNPYGPIPISSYFKPWTCTTKIMTEISNRFFQSLSVTEKIDY